MGGGSDGGITPQDGGGGRKRIGDLPGYVIPVTINDDQFRPIKPQNPPALQENGECVGGKNGEDFATKKWFDTSFSAAVTKIEKWNLFFALHRKLSRKSGVSSVFTSVIAYKRRRVPHQMEPMGEQKVLLMLFQHN
ncbi:hypothetical protein CEXT_722911 [Caerostris extrusa]|uniref:Uncharacterized protein n=1 Tax=Caerostris extrusa TaxID=172846 RepID=A0AAV4WXB6_CAEEX|nr:hypothetical protein CEXT_722911 [Caerostris extrusa]